MIPLEDEILRAFDESEFYPVFQPLVELRTGKLVGFEAFGAVAAQTTGRDPAG